MLTALGYDQENGNFIIYHESSDHYKSSGELGKTYYCVRYKVVPITNLTAENAFEIAKEYFDNNKNLNYRLSNNLFLNGKIQLNNWLKLHLLNYTWIKFANEIDSGDNYDGPIHVAEERFDTVINRILEIQEVENTNKSSCCYWSSDFFNSEADGCTSDNKIPQQNDTPI